jgi:hypothetical protein
MRKLSETRMCRYNHTAIRVVSARGADEGFLFSCPSLWDRSDWFHKLRMASNRNEDKSSA